MIDRLIRHVTVQHISDTSAAGISVGSVHTTFLGSPLTGQTSKLEILDTDPDHKPFAIF